MLGLALGVNQINAQTKTKASENDSVYVAEQKDEMTDKVYYFPSHRMVCVSADKKQGFGVSFFIEKEDNELTASELDVKIMNIGSCHENDEIIFLLEGDVKVSGKMWNKFNCDGNAWFKLNHLDKENLATKKVLKIRIQNGRTYDTYTHTVEPKDQDYFIQLFYDMKTNKVKNYK